MNIFTYLIGIFLGSILLAPILIQLLIIIRVGIIGANNIINKPDTNLYMKEVLKLQKNSYIVSFIVNFIIVSVLILGVFLFLSNSFNVFVITGVIVLLLNCSKTGFTQQNTDEFWNRYWSIESQGKIDKNILGE